MTYNKILVPYDSKTIWNCFRKCYNNCKNVKDSSNTIIKIILVYVVQNIPVPATFGIGLFKSKKIGDMITLEQYLKDITLEIKKDAENMLEENIENIERLKMSLYWYKY